VTALIQHLIQPNKYSKPEINLLVNNKICSNANEKDGSLKQVNIVALVNQHFFPFNETSAMRFDELGLNFTTNSIKRTVTTDGQLKI